MFFGGFHGLFSLLMRTAIYDNIQRDCECRQFLCNRCD